MLFCVIKSTEMLLVHTLLTRHQSFLKFECVYFHDVGPVHISFKGCWVVFFNLDVTFCGILSGSALFAFAPLKVYHADLGLHYLIFLHLESRVFQ